MRTARWAATTTVGQPVQLRTSYWLDAVALRQFYINAPLRVAAVVFVAHVVDFFMPTRSGHRDWVEGWLSRGVARLTKCTI